MEKHYTFLKENRVLDTLVFANQDNELAQRICSEQGYDQAIWLDDAPTPKRWSTYDGKTFTDPTDDYLISIGILTPSDPTPAP